jgi:hypothetical protein
MKAKKKRKRRKVKAPPFGPGPVLVLKRKSPQVFRGPAGHTARSQTTLFTVGSKKTKNTGEIISLVFGFWFTGETWCKRRRNNSADVMACLRASEMISLA